MKEEKEIKAKDDDRHLLLRALKYIWRSRANKCQDIKTNHGKRR